jgi:hydrogenase maturation protein HypF
MAAAYLADAPASVTAGLDVRRRNAARWDAVAALTRSGTASPVTTSAGRLFDAVAALVGVRDVVSYEGQAAIELEQRVADDAVGGYAARVDDGAAVVIHAQDLVAAVVEDLRDGAPAGGVAARFHRGVAEAIASAVVRVSVRCGLSTVALSGGVFQNVVLVDAVVDRLVARGFRVLLHQRVPPNDGGISLGQAVVAAHTAG